MKLTDALLGEHAVLYDLFDWVRNAAAKDAADSAGVGVAAAVGTGTGVGAGPPQAAINSTAAPMSALCR